MVKIYKQPFAHEGDAIAIPDTSQPDGKISNADGWTVDYQLPSSDPNYKPVDRQEMNGVFKEVTEALGQVQVQGAASWSPDGAPYPISAQVYHGGKQWIALRENIVEPAEGEDWTVVMTQKTVTDTLSTKADKTTQIVAGSGLAGGGDLTDNRTLSIAASHTPIGVGQTWQNVTGSRGQDVTYTNTTGRPILVIIGWGVTSQAAKNIEIYVSGVLILTQSEAAQTPANGAVSFVVPSGASYIATNLQGIGIKTWSELR